MSDKEENAFIQDRGDLIHQALHRYDPAARSFKAGEASQRASRRMPGRGVNVRIVIFKRENTKRRIRK